MSTPFTSASTATHLSNGCPSSTITPDANGHVPTGTCGYLSRPYYPSFAAALLFAFFAASVLLDFTLRVVRATRKRQWRRRREERGDCAKSGTTWVGWWYEEGMGPAWTGVILSTGLVVAYGVRAAGTKWQQVFWFVGVSDTIVLVWPVLIFAFTYNILFRTGKAFFRPDQRLPAFVNRHLERGLFFGLTLLAVEQLLASVLIAPKRIPSPGHPSSTTARLGLKIYLVGLAIQQLLTTYVTILVYTVHKALSRGRQKTFWSPASWSIWRPMRIYNVANSVSSTEEEWRDITRSLLFTLFALTIRTVYRLVELSTFFTGWFSFLAHYEVFFYMLECLPVLAALGVWTMVDLEGLGSLMEDSTFVWEEGSGRYRLLAPGESRDEHEHDDEAVGLAEAEVDSMGK